MDETAGGQSERTCPGCGRAFTVTTASRRQHCRRSCRQRAYEARRFAAAVDQAKVEARQRAEAIPNPPPVVPAPVAPPVPAERSSRRREPFRVTMADVLAQARNTLAEAPPDTKKAAR